MQCKLLATRNNFATETGNINNNIRAEVQCNDHIISYSLLFHGDRDTAVDSSNVTYNSLLLVLRIKIFNTDLFEIMALNKTIFPYDFLKLFHILLPHSQICDWFQNTKL